MRTPFDFIEELLRRLEKLAASCGVMFRALVLDLIEKALPLLGTSKTARQRSEILPVLKLRNALVLPKEKMTNAELMDLLDRAESRR